MEEISEHRIDKWETLMFTYESALKEIATKIDILNNEFIKIHNYNPIEHVTSRIKSSESIASVLSVPLLLIFTELRTALAVSQIFKC